MASFPTPQPKAPQVLNVRPYPGIYGPLVYIDGDLRFSLKDVETPIDLSLVRVGMAAGGSVYRASSLSNPEDELPAVATLETFDDWAAYGTATEVTRTFSNGPYGTLDWLTMEKTEAGVQESFYVLSASIDSRQSFHAHVWPWHEEGAAFPASYFNDARYRGGMFGVVCGPRNRGVFVFCCKDGANYQLIVTGPATAAGVRQILAVVAFDWRLPYHYVLSWNESAGREVVDIVATLDLDPTYPTYHIATVAIASIGTFSPGARFGKVHPSESGKAYTIFGVDGGVGVKAYHLHASVLPYAHDVIVDGSVLYGEEAVIVPDSLTRLVVGTPPEDQEVAPWVNGMMTGSIVASGAGLQVIKGATDVSQLPALYLRSEPRLAELNWYLRARFLISDEVVAASNYTGMGFFLTAPGWGFLLAALTDFGTKFLGVFHGAFVETQLRNEVYYDHVPNSDWSEELSLLVISDVARGVIDVFVNSEYTVSLSFLHGALPAPATKEGSISFGHIGASFIAGGTAGIFEVRELLYGTASQSYESSWGVLPNAAVIPWASDVLGPGSSVIDGNELLITDDGYGTVTPGYRRWVLSNTLIEPRSGVFIEAYFHIESWSDSIGSPNPVNTPIYAGPALDNLSDLVLLVATQDAEGNRFVYVPGSDPDATLLAVLEQTNEGTARSASVDWTEDHLYRIEYSPKNYVRVYIDSGASPAIDLSWDDRDLPNGGTTLLPSFLFGSHLPTNKTKTRCRVIRTGISEGYDLAVRKNLTQLQEDSSFSGSFGFVIEATDTDP